MAEWSAAERAAAPLIVIGLGNPGPEYEDTYHNVGFRVVDALAGRRRVRFEPAMGRARMARWGDGVEVVLVKPWTYMNRSGLVIPLLLERFGGDARLLVVSDDLALPLGRIRIRERGSAGGHNGLKSISSAYGSDEYVRVRVGIGSAQPDAAAGDSMREFVLSPIRKADRALLARAEQVAADAVEHILSTGAPSAMARFNGLDLCRAPSE